MLKVAVLAGGDSGEREVSLRSGKAVANALEQAGYAVFHVDPIDGIEKHLEKLKLADVVFIALHGTNGEDGVPQQFLESHSIPYTGANSKASDLCFNKVSYIEFLKPHAVLMPETEFVDFETFKASGLAKKPFVLKPYNGGSSLDTFIIRDIQSLDELKVEDAFSRHNKLLLQELISGIEITVPILGSKSLPVIEIIPPANEEFDYENKYNDKTQELCPPVNVTLDLQKQAQAIAEHIHRVTGCRHMSRTDIIVNGTQLYTLETNTIPGLAAQSLLPKAAAAVDLTMSDVCTQLVEAAINR
jgi:D-alanine-D-alanine ligase